MTPLAWLGPEPCHECDGEFGGDLVAWCPECGEVVCEDCQPGHETDCWPEVEQEPATPEHETVKAKRTRPAVAKTLPLPL